MFYLRHRLTVPVSIRRRDFFPIVDAGQLRLTRARRTGIEESEIYFQQVEDYIRRVIPATEINVIVDNIGAEPHQPALSDSVTVGPTDGEILVALNATHRPTAGCPRRSATSCRTGSRIRVLHPATDIVSQILNFGLPAPIDIQVTGPLAESDANFQIAADR